MRAVVLVVVLLVALAAPLGVTAQRGAYVAYLSAAEQVPANRSTAGGMASFELTAAGLRYWLVFDNITNLQMAHIHIAPPGQNGPIAVWLYPPAPPARLISGVTSGVVQDGLITNANLTGPLQGRTIRDLIAAIEAGNAYVNAHTTAFPGGEIRGQIR
ncbi:MAG: CHRD domain-containing protein [Armatimonadota bacterium]|nr:CHRD domain-containing protein [Armatimonadota bacterium]MDR7549164.1 CHRD domain-containing protein [Armatimonadota bacterium]